MLSDAQQRAARKALSDWIAREVDSQARIVAEEEVRKYLDTKEVRDEVKAEIKNIVTAAIPRLAKQFTQKIYVERY